MESIEGQVHSLSEGFEGHGVHFDQKVPIGVQQALHFVAGRQAGGLPIDALDHRFVSEHVSRMIPATNKSLFLNMLMPAN